MQAHSLSSRAASNIGGVFQGPVGLAHDAGNLLSALGLYCDLLESPEVLRAEHRHYAAELRGIARRSADLLGKLVAPQSIPVAGRSLQQVADLEPVLRQICAPESNLSLHVDADLPEVALDLEILERILVNLVRNAAEAIGRVRTERGEIRAALQNEGGDLLLTVEDNGPGMDPIMAARFVQPSSHHVPGARGVGHRILRELAQETGAGFELRVRPGRGSRFSFRWKAQGGVQPTC